MVYELIEYAKDCLTDNNRPCGQCVLCQFDFQVRASSCYCSRLLLPLLAPPSPPPPPLPPPPPSLSLSPSPPQDDEDFSKTACYHYFHTSCLVRYIHFYQQQQLEREEEEREEGLGRGNPMGGSKHRDLECPVCREAIPQGDPSVNSPITPITHHIPLVHNSASLCR